jgi:hypothetical protein
MPQRLGENKRILTMIKFPATHLIEADRAEFVSTSKPISPQIAFYVGDTDVHHVVMPRSVFEKLAGDIARALKAKSPPSQHR